MNHHVGRRQPPDSTCNRLSDRSQRLLAINKPLYSASGGEAIMQNCIHVISHFLPVKRPLAWGQGGVGPLWSVCLGGLLRPV